MLNIESQAKKTIF